MCACRGTAGFAHVSCLAEQAKIGVDEAVENNFDQARYHKRWIRWFTCGLCEQKHHGVVRCAIGWACWKAYANRTLAPSRPGMVSTDKLRGPVMIQLANGLRNGHRAKEALAINIALLDHQQRTGLDIAWIRNTQPDIANCYEQLGMEEEALGMRREMCDATKEEKGPGEYDTLVSCNNLLASLVERRHFREAKLLARENISLSVVSTCPRPGNRGARGSVL